MDKLRSYVFSLWSLTFVHSDAAITADEGKVFKADSIDQVQERLNVSGYVCGRALVTVVFLLLKVGLHLF